MTDNNISLYDEMAATEKGAQSLAAADLAGQVMRILEQALEASGVDQKTLAARLGVTEGRVSQVLNGDGNLRIAATARYIRALGYEVSLTATPVGGQGEALPRTPSRRRRKTERSHDWAWMDMHFLDSSLARDVFHVSERGAILAQFKVIPGHENVWADFQTFNEEVADYR